ncbi:phage holin family protein [Sandarakinorhabdus rubra]|uniref:phage holin family protein n=1 Tax=Sandarakinorhabdus rubra TaxID=2672568 RepID=UPI0013DA586A|nr:phage holin family protein [Sandarakinorhabdus rubra]
MAAGRPGIVAQLRQILAGLLRLLQLLAQLTTAEMKENAAALRGALLLAGAAMGLLITALTLFTVALVLALASLVGPLAASLIVATLAAIAGLALGRHALSRLEATRLAPERSIATLQAQIDRIAGTQRPATPPSQGPQT